MFNVESHVTVTQFPDWDYVMTLLPYSAAEVMRKLEDMWDYVFDVDCFISYFENTVNVINNASLILVSDVFPVISSTLGIFPKQ